MLRVKTRRVMLITPNVINIAGCKFLMHLRLICEKLSQIKYLYKTVSVEKTLSSLLLEPIATFFHLCKSGVSIEKILD